MILEAARSLVEADLTPTDDPVNITLDEVTRRYNDWNRKVFGGKLPEIEIKVSRLKGASGKTTVNYTEIKGQVPRSNSNMAYLMSLGKIKNNVQINKITMAISNAMKFTSQELDEVILHEMIHVELQAAGFISAGHGPQFESRRRELSAKVGFEIPKVHDIVQLKLNDKTNAKEVLVLLKPKGMEKYAVFFQPVLSDKITAWLERSSAQDLTLYKVKTTLVGKYPVKRSLPRGSFDLFGISPEEAKHIEQEGKVIFGQSIKPLAQRPGGTQVNKK